MEATTITAQADSSDSPKPLPSPDRAQILSLQNSVRIAEEGHASALVSLAFERSERRGTEAALAIEHAKSENRCRLLLEEIRSLELAAENQAADRRKSDEAAARELREARAENARLVADVNRLKTELELAKHRGVVIPGPEFATIYSMPSTLPPPPAELTAEGQQGGRS